MNVKMYFGLIVSCTLGLSSIALADHHMEKELPPGHPPVGMFEKMDADKNGTVSKVEFDTHHTMMFEQIDMNKDGSLSQDEAKNFHEAKKSEMHMKMKESHPSPMPVQ